MAAESRNAALVGDREIRGTRVFDARRGLVWKVWTEPEHIGQWWGPHGFTTTTHKMEVKTGGVWGFVLHRPDWRAYQNKIPFTEGVKPGGGGVQARGDRRQGRPRPRAREFPRDGDFRGGGRQDAPRHALGVPVRQGARLRGQELRRRRGHAPAPGTPRRVPGEGGGVVSTDRRMFLKSEPLVYRDFWTSAYQAIDD